MASVLMLVSILVILAFAFEAFGVSAPKASTKKSKSADEKRAEANTYFDQGKRFQDQKNFKEAARKYEKAVKADPNYAEAHSNLGFSYRKRTWEKPMPRWENSIWLKKSCKHYATWVPMKPMNWPNLLTRKKPVIDV
jgi:tetratricopeptide (TPR) repeat protein